MVDPKKTKLLRRNLPQFAVLDERIRVQARLNYLLIWANPVEYDSSVELASNNLFEHFDNNKVDYFSQISGNYQ